MAVYDLAHKLGEQVKKSEEYREYQKLRQEIMEDKDTRKMITDYQNLNLQISSARAWGQEIDEDRQKKLDKLEELVRMSNKARNYLEAESRFSLMIQDIQKIIFEDLELGLEEKEDD